MHNSQIHFSSPCQDFSKANRHQSRRRDRADLSLLLVDLVRMTSCSTAVFENVMGLLDSRSNVQYLKTISMGLIKLGYQIRCTCLRACDYGDPQVRNAYCRRKKLKHCTHCQSDKATLFHVYCKELCSYAFLPSKDPRN